MDLLLRQRGLFGSEYTVKVNSGRDYKHLNQGDIPVYGTGGYMLSVDESLSDEDAVGIGRKGTIDKPQFLKAPFWTVDTLFFMTPKPNNGLRFLFALSQGIEWAKLDESTGVPSLSKVNIENILEFIPNLYEQTTIGSFFRTLDEVIHATQRKVAGLKQLKAAYLQQMFPQAGEKVPRVRFGGFSEDWKIRTIESFADVKTGGKDTQDAILSGEYDFYVRSPKIEKINSYSFDGEAVLTVGDGVGVGKVFHYVNGKFDYHQRVYKISDFIDVYGLFFYQYFATNFIKESRKYNAKTSVDSVRREMITKMLIPCPTIEEQITIGDFVHNLDTQITAKSEKTEKLKQLKSAYLQKMFI